MTNQIKPSVMFLVTLSDPGLIGLVLSNMTNVALLSLSLWVQGGAGTILGICLKSDTQWLLLIFVEGLKNSPPLFPNQIEFRLFFLCH